MKKNIQRSKKVARIWPYEDCSIVDFQELIFNLWFDALSANPPKWSDTLKQFVGKLPTNCLSVFDHFVRLVLKGLTSEISFEGDSTATRTTTIRAISIEDQKVCHRLREQFEFRTLLVSSGFKNMEYFPREKEELSLYIGWKHSSFLVLSVFYLISTRITINLLMTCVLVDLIYRTLQYYQLLGYLERLKIDKK